MDFEQFKIGIILNHIQLRSDIRLFIEELSNKATVVLFGTEEEKDIIESKNCEYRIIKNQSDGFVARLYNRILKEFFYFFGNIPLTKNQYNDYVIRALYKSNHGYSLKKMMFKHKLKMYLPKIFVFDNYLKIISAKNNHIDDIGCFISFTNVKYDNLIAQIVQSNIKLFTYVHSWDHIPKFNRFSMKTINYVVWNDKIKRDLMNVHRVDEENISILGASQFYFIKEYLNLDRKNVNNFEYIYFPCTWGYPIVAKQEVKIIELVSEVLYKIDSNIKLMIRPYPILDNWKLYDVLKRKKNIVFDNYTRKKNMLLNKDVHLEKCEMIDNALAVFHTGTTIGLESSYFDVPVIYLNIQDIDYGVKQDNRNHIFYSWSQYHLKNYYCFKNYQSVVFNKKELDVIIRLVLEKNKQLLNYNKTLSSYSPLMYIEEFSSEFLNLIK